MQRVCEKLKRTDLYIDDILCFSTTGKQHVKDLWKFLARLTKFNLRLSLKKTYVAAKSVKFLGHIV